VRFKALDDGHGGTKIVPNMALAKPIPQAAPEKDSDHHPTANHAAASSVSTDNFRFGDLAGFGQRGEHGSTSLDVNFSLGAESAASDQSHDGLQQTMIGGFHLDFASGTVPPIGQQHFVNRVHGDFIL
jgi:hypothetical protein